MNNFIVRRVFTMIRQRRINRKIIKNLSFLRTLVLDEFDNLYVQLKRVREELEEIRMLLGRSSLLPSATEMSYRDKYQTI